MEVLFAVFSLYSTQIVSFLVIGIGILLFLLLIFPSKTHGVEPPEVGGTRKIEGALRRVLGEQSWPQAGGKKEASGDEVEKLEQEILEKDRKIMELTKQSTGGGGTGSELISKVHDLEERLKEYEILEDDMADLSLYKNENKKLKEELEKLKASSGEKTEASPSEEGEEEEEKGRSRLVTEFENIVNSQENFGDTEASKETEEDLGDSTPFVHDGETPATGQAEVKTPEVESKGEAEQLVSEFKSLGENKAEESPPQEPQQAAEPEPPTQDSKTAESQPAAESKAEESPPSQEKEAKKEEEAKA